MRIFILSSSRSGSNYLNHMIYRYSPKNTLCINEPFSLDKFGIIEDSKKDFYLKNKVNECVKNDNIVLKTHFNQLTTIKDQHYIDFFLKNKIWYKILLLRKDLFRCTFSHAVADNLRNFNSRNYFETSITIKEKIFQHVLNNKIDYWIKFSMLKQEGNYDKIIYFEDLSFDFDIDRANLNLPIEKNVQNNIYKNPRTPYNIINVSNENNLKEIFNEVISKFSSEYITNKNGILELK